VKLALPAEPDPRRENVLPAFGIVTDCDDELPEAFVMINAIDHATSAKRQAAAGIITQSTREGISQSEGTAFKKYQTM
jgi:poly(3-hydroxybutyrate) depolymerase